MLAENLAQLAKDGFYGTIHLRDWWTVPSGRRVTALTGTIYVRSAKEVMGFDVNERDSNWCVIVAGTTESEVLLGCQVRGAHQHAEGVEYGEGYVVP